MFFNPTTPIAQRLARVIGGVCGVLAHHAACIRPVTHGLVAVLVAVHGRLSRMVARLDRIALLWRAGQLRPSAPPRVRPRRLDHPRPLPAPRLYIPSGQAFLFRLVQRTAQHAGMVEMFLADPETASLVEAAPQAGRILRPLCRMFGLPVPAYLRRPKPPRVPAVARPRPATPRPPPRRLYDLLHPVAQDPVGPSFLASHVFSA